MVKNLLVIISERGLPGKGVESGGRGILRPMVASSRWVLAILTGVPLLTSRKNLGDTDSTPAG